VKDVAVPNEQRVRDADRKENRKTPEIDRRHVRAPVRGTGELDGEAKPATQLLCPTTPETDRGPRPAQA
jgi:hypothetical protein